MCLFIIFDVCIFNKEQIINHKKETVLLTAITILVSMPLFMDGMVYPVGDTDFHLMRIEGIYNELLLGHIPARIQSVWGSGNGYPVSVFYGDILLYIPAFLRLMGFTVTFAYAAFVFFINVITVLISFFSFKTIVRNINLSLLMTLTYVTATYRMVGIYKAGIVGTYSAMCFLPMAAAAIFLIYTDKTQFKVRYDTRCCYDRNNYCPLIVDSYGHRSIITFLFVGDKENYQTQNYFDITLIDFIFWSFIYVLYYSIFGLLFQRRYCNKL